MTWNITPFVAVSFEAAKAEVTRQFEQMKTWSRPYPEQVAEYEAAKSQVLAAIDLCAPSTLPITTEYGVRVEGFGSKGANTPGTFKVDVSCVQMVGLRFVTPASPVGNAVPGAIVGSFIAAVPVASGTVSAIPGVPDVSTAILKGGVSSPSELVGDSTK